MDAALPVKLKWGSTARDSLPNVSQDAETLLLLLMRNVMFSQKGALIVSLTKAGLVQPQAALKSVMMEYQ